MKAHTTSKISGTLLEKLRELDKTALEIFYKRAYLDGMEVPHDDAMQVHLETKLKISKSDIGISVSCDGVCLTLISYKKNVVEFYLSDETLKKSKFKDIKI